jgi:hypothetical protein
MDVRIPTSIIVHYVINVIFVSMCARFVLAAIPNALVNGVDIKYEREI